MLLVTAGQSSKPFLPSTYFFSSLSSFFSFVLELVLIVLSISVVLTLVLCCVVQTLQIQSADAPLLGLGSPNPFPTPFLTPDLSQGVGFNLFNNLWGTNYIMHYPYAFSQQIDASREDSTATGASTTLNSGDENIQYRFSFGF
jgi:hypothetical protein